MLLDLCIYVISAQAFRYFSTKVGIMKIEVKLADGLPHTGYSSSDDEENGMQL